MTRFLDGPAARVSLMIRRAPPFLRVVESHRKGEWDALDQVDDEPRPKETIYAYRRTKKPGVCHIKATRRSASGWYPMADYSFVAEQPADEVMRSRETWRAWCVEQARAEDGAQAQA